MAGNVAVSLPISRAFPILRGYGMLSCNLCHPLPCQENLYFLRVYQEA